MIILENEKCRGFEPVREECKKTVGEPTLPTLGTSDSMACDFYANKDYKVEPNEICKIWTDVKAYMQKYEGLIINVRSSMGGKFMLANTQGWIDKDYYSNESNDGNIGVFLYNISDETQYIKKGDRIAQGMFIQFLPVDNVFSDKVRKGGYGSTNEK